MTPEQRYFFDLTGYLHLQGVLQGEALQKAQEAAQRYMDTSPDQLPPGFEYRPDREHFKWYLHAFAFDKALEALTVHPATWSILKELTWNKPRLTSGNMMVNTHEGLFHPLHSGLHGSPSNNQETTRYFCQDGKIYCNDLVVFFYLTDVFPGDGGLIIVPGSHKSQFERPKNMFYPDTYDNKGYVADQVPPGVVSFAPRAGDVVIISELIIHGALSWKPKDRDRRFLTLRYMPQHFAVRGGFDPFPEPIKARLSPQTLELIAAAPYKDTKEIATQEQVVLS